MCFILLIVILKLERVHTLHCEHMKLYILKIFQMCGMISPLENYCEPQAESNAGVSDIVGFCIQVILRNGVRKDAIWEQILMNNTK